MENKLQLGLFILLLLSVLMTGLSHHMFAVEGLEEYCCYYYTYHYSYHYTTNNHTNDNKRGTLRLARTY